MRFKVSSSMFSSIPVQGLTDLFYITGVASNFVLKDGLIATRFFFCQSGKLHREVGDFITVCLWLLLVILQTSYRGSMLFSPSLHHRYETVRKHEFQQIFQAIPALRPLYTQWEKDYDAEALYWVIVDNSWLPWFSIVLYILFIFGYPEVSPSLEIVILDANNSC